MLQADILIHYVNNPIKSASFYQELTGDKPVELSPTFALFVFKSGIKLGLWSRHTVEPMLNSFKPGSHELMFTVKTRKQVDEYYEKYGQSGFLTILQKPMALDFGYAFAAMDCDGHRIRIGALEG